MAKNRQQLFSRLSRLFRAGPLVKRKVRGFDTANVKSSAIDVFRKSTATVYGNSLNAYGQYDRLSISGETLIMVPGPERELTLNQLIDRYPNGEKFLVYAYDHEKEHVVPAWAHHPRITGVKDTVKITFDDGKTLVCTPDHECMLRNGEYRDAQDLKPGDSMMPFYRKEFQGRSSKDGKKFYGYQSVLTFNREAKNSWNGWQAEHKLIAEWFYKREQQENEHIHHKDFNSKNNNPDNLEFMDAFEHLSLHGKKTSEQWKNLEVRQKMIDGFKAAWENNPERKERLVEFNKLDSTREKRRDYLLNNNPAQNEDVKRKIGKKTKEFYKLKKENFFNKDLRFIEKEFINEYKSDVRSYAKYYKVNPSVMSGWLKERNVDHIFSQVVSDSFSNHWDGKNRKKSCSKISIDEICLSSKKCSSTNVKDISKHMDVSSDSIVRFLKKNGYSGWRDFKSEVLQENLNNHKVVSVEFYETLPCGDLTVDGYENFATDSIFVHNSRYADFSEMEYCLIESTKIAVPDGYRTIKELADEYGLDKEFIVYAYDHNTGGLTPALAKQARKTRTDHAWKVIFENGQEIVGTANHRLMKRDGTFCKIEDLIVGDSMMPFYRKDFHHESKADEGEGYRWIYTINDGWVKEHTFIAEWANKRKVQPGECVHHKNYKKWDNRPENLQIMTISEHSTLHNNEDKWSENNQEWIEWFKKTHSSWMRENNPAERKDITFGRILETCENIGFNLYKISDAFDTDPNVIKRRLRENGYRDFITFAKAYNPEWRSDSWDNSGEKNPRYNKELTFQKICDVFEKVSSFKELQKELGCSHIPITKRLKENGFKNYTDFANNYRNHKVAKIEYYGYVDLYDLTVDGYKNFATDTVISHNTPEIASALDIYADESVAKDEKGRSLHIYSENPKIKKLLEELFYDTLNFEFTARSWIRNLIKYGDFFLLNDISPKYGFINAHPIPVNEIEREEGFDPDNPFAVRFRWVTEGNQILENWQVTHFRLMGNDTFLPYGSCLSGDTRVLTPDGSKEIQHIRPGDEVISFDLETQNKVVSKVLEQVCSGIKSTYKIRTKHNFIDVSKEHKIAVLDENENIEYKSVDQIFIGDRLIINKFHNLEKDIEINKEKPNSNKNGYWNNIDLIPDYVNEDFASLFGFLIGDGWISNDNSVFFAMGEHDDLNFKYSKLLEKFSGREARYFDPNDNQNTKLEKSQCCVGSKMLSTILQRMGFVGNVYSKRTPEWVFSANKNIKEAFLRGLHDADGSLFVDKWGCKRYSIELANEQLVKDVKILIQSLGRKSGKICSREPRVTVINERKVESSETNYFYYYESLVEQYKKYDIGDRKTEDFIVTPVIAIEENREEKVYDIHVDNGNHNFFANGILVHNSMLESSRRIWRQLVMAEDSMLVYRVIRSPERRVFYIDVANAPPNEVGNIIENARATLKSQEVADKSAGRVDLRYNPWSVDIDYFIPVRGTEAGTRVDTLPGGANTTAIDDVEYIQKKLFAALKVPKAYLGYEEALSGRSNLAQEDVRFARSIQQIQQVIISELNKIASLHLATHGYDGEDLINFNLQLSNPSTMAQTQKLELMRMKFEIAGLRPEGLLTDKFLYKEIFNMNEDAIQKLSDDQIKELIRKAQLEQMGAAAAEGEGGLGGGGGGGGLGGGGGGGLGGLGGLETPDEGGDESGDDLGGDDEAGGGGDDLFAGEDRVGPLMTDDEDKTLDFELEEGDDEYKPVNQQNQISRFRHNNLRPSRRKKFAWSGPKSPTDFSNIHRNDSPFGQKGKGSGILDALDRTMFEIEDSENYRTRLSSEMASTIKSLEKTLINSRGQTLTDSVNRESDDLIIESDEEENE